MMPAIQIRQLKQWSTSISVMVTPLDLEESKSPVLKVVRSIVRPFVHEIVKKEKEIHAILLSHLEQ